MTKHEEGIEAAWSVFINGTEHIGNPTQAYYAFKDAITTYYDTVGLTDRIERTTGLLNESADTITALQARVDGLETQIRALTEDHHETLKLFEASQARVRELEGALDESHAESNRLRQELNAAIELGVEYAQKSGRAALKGEG